MFGLMPVWIDWSPKLFKIFIYIFEPLLSNFLKNLKLLKIQPETYMLNMLINTCLYTLILFLITYSSYYVMNVPYDLSFIGIIFLTVLIFFIFYPKIIITQLRERLDRELFYALRDLTIQVSAGLPIYTAIKNIGKGNYGIVSEEFKKVVADIEAGLSIDEALKRMMDRTYSEYLRRVLWQVIIVIKSGSPIVDVLEDILRSLKESQNRKLSEYLYEMNLWVIIYLMIAVTIPALAFVLSTVFVVFGGINPFSLILSVIIFSAIFQVLATWYVKLRRPNIVE